MATAFRWEEEMNGAALNPQRELQQVKAEKLMPVAKAAQKLKPLTPLRRKMVGGDFYTVKRIDNSRLVRHVEPVKLRNLYKTMALGGFVALFCMLYVYQHFRCIDLSFQLEDLRGKQEQASSLNSELKLEISGLRDPHRIDVIAQHQLGLKRPDAAQVRDYTTYDGEQVASVRLPGTNRVP
jgi:cell division protein FtsL